jgi:hypothetical protein
MAPPPQFVPSGSALQHRLITIEQLLKTTWEFLRDQFWMAVLLGLILLALGFVTALITTPLNIAAQATNDVRVVVGAQVLGQFLSVFVQVFIQLGGVITALHWARTGTIDIAQVFKAGTFYLRGLGLTLLIQLITLGVLLICAIPLLASIPSRNEDQMIVCGVLGLLVAMPIIIWLTLNWYIAMPILVDRNSSIREAMSLSRFYMAGNRLTVFVTNLVFGLISLPVVICTCGLGAIPLAPVASLFLVLVYLVSTGQTFHQPGIQPVLAYPNQGFPSPLQAGPQMPPVPPATPPAAGQDNPFSRPPGSLS